MRDPELVVTGFDRPNIWLGVETFFHADEKLDRLAEAVAAEPKPGIVYAATHAHAEALCSRLERSVVYHAGLSKRQRDAAQDDFMADRVDVVVATIAFGMGIDKPNVRFVFHAEISESLDEYYQEIGRGGRDGDPARAVLFYRPEDVGMRRFFAGGGGDRHAYQLSRVAIAREYAEARSCRRAFLLGYFGEEYVPPCGNCDVCDAGGGALTAAHPFAVGARVRHARFGEGAVHGYDGDKLIVLFDGSGFKTLALEHVDGLLEPD
jgi:ATP-dependent DNA helicase RecQ